MRLAAAVLTLAWLCAWAASAQRFGAPTSDGRPAFACGAPEARLEPVGETPGRAAVVAAMTPLQAMLEACAPTFHGEIGWRFYFRGSDGAPLEVQISRVDGPMPVDAELRCMEVAACGVRLPPFARADFTVNFPFRL